MDSFLPQPLLTPIQGLLATQLMSCGSDLSWDFAQEFREPGEGGELDEACLLGLSSTIERLTGVALPVAVRPLAPIPEQEVDEDAWHDILGDARALAMIGWEGEWFSVVGLRGWSRALEDLRERMACNALAYEGPFKQADRPSLDTRASLVGRAVVHPGLG